MQSALALFSGPLLASLGTLLAWGLSIRILRASHRLEPRRAVPLFGCRSSVALSLSMLGLGVVWGYFSVPPAPALSLPAHLALALMPAGLPLAMIALWRQLRGQQAPPELRLKSRVVMGLSLGWILMWVGGALLTDVSTTSPRSVEEDHTWLRLQLHPRDSEANLQMAWYDRDREAFDDALRHASAARQFGVDEVLVLHVESEILAARGECLEAQATFDRALVAMAERALDTALEENLSLGGFSLPPTLIARCGVSDTEATAP